jgi:hypothetical protein
VVLAAALPAASAITKEPPVIRPWHQIGIGGAGDVAVGCRVPYGQHSDLYFWALRVPGGEALFWMDYAALVVYGRQGDEQRVRAGLAMFRRREMKLLRKRRIPPERADEAGPAPLTAR